MEIDIPDLQDLEFESRCSFCSGDGNIPQYPRRYKKGDTIPTITCRQCNGSGIIITEVGRKLIAFLLRRNVSLTKIEGD